MTADTSKQTPKLRFPEFRDAGEWEYRTLKELSVQILEKVGETKLTPVSITAGYGFVSQEEKFGRNISGVQYKNYIFLRRGDFAYNRGNSKKYPQGYVCQLKEFDQAAASTAFICFQLKDGHKAGYFQALFDKNLHGIQLSRYITSGARSDGLLNISAEKFFSINLPIPKQFEEQAKIADCLDSIDELIGAESQKLDALKTYKKGMMEQLFPAEGETVPKLRFPEFRDAPEWENIRFGNALKIISGKGFMASEYSSTGVRLLQIENVGYGSIKWGENTSHLPEDYIEQYEDLVLKKDDIVLALNRPITNNELKIAKLKKHDTPSILYQRVGRIEEVSDFLNRDFTFHLCQKFIKSFVIKQSIGSDQPFISIKDLYNQNIVIPLRSEQQRIADFLSSLDEQIDSQSKKLHALKQHKQGLMQQLFPSSNEGQAIEEDGMEIVEA